MELLDRLEAVLLGHEDVRHHYRHGLGAEARHRLLAVRRGHHLVAGLGEEGVEEVAHLRVVVDGEDRGHGVSSLVRGGGGGRG